MNNVFNTLLSFGMLCSITAYANVAPAPEYTAKLDGYSARMDQLCFRNPNYEAFHPSLGEHFFLTSLRLLANREGACQGIAALSKASYQFIEFDPTGPTLSLEEIEDRLSRALRLHRFGCRPQDRRILITGVGSLRELCHQMPERFQEAVLLENAYLTARDTVQELWRLGFERQSVVQKTLSARTLKSTISRLQKNIPAMILLGRHVVLATEVSTNRVGNQYVSNLKFYDPNYSDVLRNRTYILKSDFSMVDEFIGEVPGPVGLVDPDFHSDVCTVLEAGL